MTNEILTDYVVGRCSKLGEKNTTKSKQLMNEWSVNVLLGCSSITKAFGRSAMVKGDEEYYFGLVKNVAGYVL